MYKLKPTLLVNQQKRRGVPNCVNTNNWGSKSLFNTKKFLFLVSNQYSIDLRLYKLLLRKCKKKLLKMCVKPFVYLTPNTKTSHKTKNARMGKGKGMNNRFYCRFKKNRPILIFINFSLFRLHKLKRFLTKFFHYKYLIC